MDQHHLHDYWVSRTLDAPQLVFMWEADRAYFSILWVLGGALMDNMILGIVAAAVFGRFYAYLKEEGGRGLLPRILYWYTPSSYWLSQYLPSYAREYLGR